MALDTTLIIFNLKPLRIVLVFYFLAFIMKYYRSTTMF